MKQSEPTNTYYGILIKIMNIKTNKNWGELSPFEQNALIEIQNHYKAKKPACDRIEELSKFAIKQKIDLNILIEAQKNDTVYQQKGA